ncbi:Protein-tyrosine phosphatase mitochondrial 1 [Gossypium arboreum]|uniref:Protein-tyrosine phosphatase mitochondrial 1 n=1 Tax=Gossypium arboreum TaxID=29729 RepID=A0A0B0MXE1_GOSAR|nr:Protein-tyrosine phosphatase mitochondrial 1 [Gossypium arboreum]
MHIEELKEGEQQDQDQSQLCEDRLVVWDAKRVLVGAGARALFYPTLLYNLVRNKIQSEFRWWDRVDEFILLGAVPFPADVPRLKDLGVSGVVTLNEPYETLVPTSLYHVSVLLYVEEGALYVEHLFIFTFKAHNIHHLVIPTRDYLFAPSFADICQAVDFIHENASVGKTTYVHCKAGRGRSTTIVLCYLVEHRHMTPDAAYEYVRSIRPRVLLAPAQQQAVQDYYLHKVNNNGICGDSCSMIIKKTLVVAAKQDTAVFDDGSVVVVTESDLDGYDASFDTDVLSNKMLDEGSLAGRLQFASQAAMTRLSCLWLRCRAEQKASRKLLSSLGIDIRVY